MSHNLAPLDVTAGDRILFGKSSGQEIRLDGKDCTSGIHAIEPATGKCPARRTPSNDGRGVLFEAAPDGDLHVNVTHGPKTQAVSGWAGPAGVAGGLFNTRTVGDVSPGRFVGHIRNMIFA